MREKIVISILMVVLFCSGTGLYGAKFQIISLKDGTVLRGEVIEMKDQVYKVKTIAMGELEIPADQITSIVDAASATSMPEPAPPAIHEGRRSTYYEGSTYATATYQPESKPSSESSSKWQSERTPPSSNNLSQQQDNVNSRIKSMTANGDFLDQLMSLSQNPDMIDVMSDPELMEAIDNCDYDMLMNNEKMRKLMENSATQNLLGTFDE